MRPFYADWDLMSATLAGGRVLTMKKRGIQAFAWLASSLAAPDTAGGSGW